MMVTNYGDVADELPGGSMMITFAGAGCCTAASQETITPSKVSKTVSHAANANACGLDQDGRSLRRTSAEALGAVGTRSAAVSPISSR
jgi:hypothetical protein